MDDSIKEKIPKTVPEFVVKTPLRSYTALCLKI